MPYQNFELRHYPLMLAPWYRLSDLMEAITSIRRINFSIVESRQQALEKLNSMTVYHPFGVAVRFPGNEAYVCEALGDWGRKFQQLKSSLSLKERTKEILAKSSIQDVHDKTYEVSDSSQAFWNSTTAFYNQLARLEGVFERDNFETFVNLRWADAV